MVEVGICNIYISLFGNKFWVILSSGLVGAYFRRWVASWQVGPPCHLLTLKDREAPRGPPELESEEIRVVGPCNVG